MEKNKPYRFFEVITQDDWLNLAKNLGRVASQPEDEILLIEAEEVIEVLPPSRMITRKDHPEIFDKLEQYFGQQDAEQ